MNLMLPQSQAGFRAPAPVVQDGPRDRVDAGLCRSAATIGQMMVSRVSCTKEKFAHGGLKSEVQHYLITENAER